MKKRSKNEFKISAEAWRLEIVWFIGWYYSNSFF